MAISPSSSDPALEDSRSGGVNVSGQAQMTVTGDVVGRDKYVGYTAEQVDVLLARIRTEFQPKPYDGQSPYVGLASFQEQDAAKFFGREALVSALVTRVATCSATPDARAIFVAGPSGSGKSSLVRAGLVPTLKKNAIPGSARWLYETLKPGRNPLDELGRVAAGLAGKLDARQDITTRGLTDPTILHQWADIALGDNAARRALIFVDQFEEIFTQVSKEQERAAFLNLLTQAATREIGRVIVLFTLRSDFVTNCASYEDLNALLNRQFLQVGAMTPEELVSAIARPALGVGMRLDPALVAHIVNDVRGEPGALPLMQFALQDLFEAEKSKGEMTLDGYVARGGLRKALERHADAEFAKLDAAEAQLARTIFSGLIEVGRGTVDTKRTALFQELVPAGAEPERVKALVTELADARLITTDEHEGKITVTLAHERLLDAWSWLRELVAEERDAIALRNEIIQDARDWDESKRSADYLYRGARLATAQEKLQQKQLGLSGLALQFVQAGIAAQEQELQEVAARGQRELEQARELARAQEQRAQVQEQARQESERLNRELERQLHISDARRLSVQAVASAERNPGLALLLAAEAMRRHDSLVVRNTFLRVLNAQPQLRRYLRTGYACPGYVAFSPDGKLFATGGIDRQITLWDAARLESVGKPMSHEDDIKALAFSADGLTVASMTSGGSITFWNVETQESQRTWAPPLQDFDVAALNVDADIAAYGTADAILLFDLKSWQATGKPLVRKESGMRRGAPSCMCFSANGAQIVIGYADGLIIPWDLKSYAPLGAALTEHQKLEHESPIYVSPYQRDLKITALCVGTDRMLFSGDSNGRICVFYSYDGFYDFTRSVTHDVPIASLAYDPNLKHLAVGDSNGMVRIWKIEKG